MSDLYAMSIGNPHHFQFELLGVGRQRGAEGAESRGTIVTRTPPDALVVLFADERLGSRWYRFRLHRPQWKPEHTDGPIRIGFDTPDVLQRFVTACPQAWSVKEGKLIGKAASTGAYEKPFLTYNTHFNRISKVVIRGSVAPGVRAPVDRRRSRDTRVGARDTRRSRGILPGMMGPGVIQPQPGVGRGRGGLKQPIPRAGFGGRWFAKPPTNFRVGVGRINLIFNWELRDENHYRNGEVCTVQKGHALIPGKEHTITIEQAGPNVIVSVDNKRLYTTEATLDGTVTVYPAHGSTISVSDITIQGTPDLLRKVYGHSHSSTY